MPANEGIKLANLGMANQEKSDINVFAQAVPAWEPPPK